MVLVCGCVGGAMAGCCAKERLEKEKSNLARDVDAVKPEAVLPAFFSERYTSLRLRWPCAPLCERVCASCADAPLRKRRPAPEPPRRPVAGGGATLGGGDATHRLAQWQPRSSGSSRASAARRVRLPGPFRARERAAAKTSWQRRQPLLPIDQRTLIGVRTCGSD